MRIAFRMSVNQGMAKEYQKRHDEIWGSLTTILLLHGVNSYSIFLDETDGSLFGYADIDDVSKWHAIASTEVCQKWWKFMSDIMPTHDDQSPKSIPLREVFHLEKPA